MDADCRQRYLVTAVFSLSAARHNSSVDQEIPQWTVSAVRCASSRNSSEKSGNANVEGSIVKEEGIVEHRTEQFRPMARQKKKAQSNQSSRQFSKQNNNYNDSSTTVTQDAKVKKKLDDASIEQRRK
uniref:Uncharacterized protein n=1 Tax=Globodera rostochiensis TaxID=31243 RepID=A0A914HZF7_GLORO